ncbi:glycosyltransferase family 4 protein [Patescibacteria group bacterium]|nr:glycosyltransferase family 4 protein [Patescibacteria group bacterium]
MKIVFFTRLFYPHIGGVEKHVLEISKRLVERGHDVTIFTEKLNKSHSLSKQPLARSAKLRGEIDGIKIIRIDPGANNWFKKIRIWARLFEHCFVLKQADVIHCHDIFFWYLPFHFLFFKKPVFTTFHGYEENNIPGKKAILMHKIAEVLSKGNLCIGEFYKKWYGTNATFVSFGATNSNDEKINSNRRIAYLGRLEEEAGIMEYLRALKVLSDKKYKLKLDIFGDGSQRLLAKDYARDNNLDVSFKGFVNNADESLKNYEYVFVSRYLGILEALARKKTVFAIYNNEIKKDYLEMSPFKEYIAISGNHLELAKMLEAVIKNPNKEKAKIISGYNWTRKQTWEKMVNLYLKLWFMGKSSLQ